MILYYYIFQLNASLSFLENIDCLNYSKIAIYIQKKIKSDPMLRSCSPKRGTTYFSNENVNGFMKESAQCKNSFNPGTTSSIKKASSPYGHNLAQKYVLSKGTKSSIKLSHKYDSKKKYLFNNTAYGTPFEKTMSPSYLSTPNEKSFALQSKSLSQTLDLMMSQKSRTMKNLKRLIRKDQQHLLSTEQQNLSENTVKVKFLINQTLSKENSKAKNHIHKCQAKNSLKIVQKTYENYANFSAMKEEFLKDPKCLSEQVKNTMHAFYGFQTVPYSYTLTHQINSPQNCTFQWLLQKNIREIQLVPIFIHKPILYQSLEFKDFQILQHLGSGGFSTVYLAKCNLNGKLCALKLIKKQSITTPKKIKMLQNEKNILININHPNLVKLYYAFESENYVIFGLQYCPNGNLYNFLQKRKSLSEDQAKFIFKQILNGVNYLHEKNVLFRDIKLENILFDSQGGIKITDFGLSKPNVNDQQITYSYCGSPQYMAPQMLTKQGHSFEVDFYALGILLYQLLFGRSPFYAPKKEDIFSGIMNSEVSFPKNPIVSKEVKCLIKGLLEKNPKRRIGSLKGIKQVRGHPWLRLSLNDSESQNPFHFKITYQSQNSSSQQNKKIKDQFEGQKLSVNPERYFFTNSFVNESFRKQIQANSVVFLHQQFRMKKTKKVKQIQNTSVYVQKQNQSYSYFKKQKHLQRKTQSKASSKNKLKSKKLI